MKKALPLLFSSTLLAAAGAAAQQAPEPAAKAAPALKLRLEDAGLSRPRITFGPKEGGGQDAASGLPSLGPGPSRTFDGPARSASPSGSVYPKDSERDRQ